MYFTVTEILYLKNDDMHDEDNPVIFSFDQITGYELYRMMKKVDSADDPGETSHPHRFYNRTDAEQLLFRFDISEAREVEQKTAGSYHWEIVCRRLVDS